MHRSELFEVKDIRLNIEYSMLRNLEGGHAYFKNVGPLLNLVFYS